MAAGFHLINATRREQVLFAHLPVNTSWEISGHPVASTMVAWYLLHHVGDEISFVPDDGSHWPFVSLTRNEASGFREVTDELIRELVDAGLVSDNGVEVLDEGDPVVFMRKVSRVWSGAGLPVEDVA